MVLNLPLDYVIGHSTVSRDVFDLAARFIHWNHDFGGCQKLRGVCPTDLLTIRVRFHYRRPSFLAKNDEISNSSSQRKCRRGLFRETCDNDFRHFAIKRDIGAQPLCMVSGGTKVLISTYCRQFGDPFETCVTLKV